MDFMLSYSTSALSPIEECYEVVLLYDFGFQKYTT
jgi:hypothetical protein